MNSIDARRSTLVLVDYQVRLMPAIHDAGRVLSTAVLLAQAARALGIPVIGTEQNPASLGPNVEAVKPLCDVTLPKHHFDACGDGLVETIRAGSPDRGDVVIAGCEAHVCLLQTALGLLRAGRPVWVVSDACGSRRAGDHAVAMDRLARAGATVMTGEMAVFEWLGDSRHPRFREVLALVKAAF